MAAPSGPVACFSYLAAASLWKVARFPSANHGAEVDEIEESVAADGLTVAAVLAALGQPSLLITNSIGDDPAGRQVRIWLKQRQVQINAAAEADAATPRIVVVGDSHQTRTMFPYLPGVADELEHVDLAALGGASFAYIDGYKMLGKAAARAIQAARSVALPLLVNLGGDDVSDELLAALDGYPGLIVQTSTADESLETAIQLAMYMQADMQCEWAVITAGKEGAAAAGKRGVVSVPAFRAEVRHTHCAGAAFSGGLTYGLMQSWTMQDCLDLAAASGAMHCERMHDEFMPTLDELRAFMQSRQRQAASTA
jgi:sugar/nucleoside kinase (ribokinase family)